MALVHGGELPSVPVGRCVEGSHAGAPGTLARLHTGCALSRLPKADTGAASPYLYPLACSSCTKSPHHTSLPGPDDARAQRLQTKVAVRCDSLPSLFRYTAATSFCPAAMRFLPAAPRAPVHRETGAGLTELRGAHPTPDRRRCVRCHFGSKSRRPTGEPARLPLQGRARARDPLGA